MVVNQITVAKATGKALASLNDRYGYLVKDFVNKDTAQTIMELCNDRDNSEIAAIKMAYRIATMPDSDAIAEGFKSVSQMIEKLVGIKKAMISNYRTVGKMFIDPEDRRSFKYHDYLHGFTVTQLAEGCAKVGIPAFERDIIDGIITPDMSAKKIRDHYKEEKAVVDGEITSESNVDGADNDGADNGADNDGADNNGAENGGAVLVLTDDNNNPIADLIPKNGYEIDGIVAMMEAGAVKYTLLQ